MKRAFEPSHEATSQTPSHTVTAHLKPPAKSVSKKARRGSIRSFCSHFQDETTPTAVVATKRSRDVWPSSAQRKFENMGIHTPLPVEGLLSSGAKAGSTLKQFPTRKSSPDTGHDDDFVLFSQSDYVRGSQGAIGTPEVLSCHDTQVAITGFHGFASQRSRPTQQGHVWPAQQPSQMSRLCMLSVHAENDDADGHVSGISQSHMSDVTQHSQPTRLNCEAHATTPELECCVHKSDAKLDEPTSQELKPPKMFNIFLPHEQQRHLILIRHGESEYNRAALEGSGFKDPMIFDPRLTAKGVTQARDLRTRLQHQLGMHGNALWVVSPLRRAIQTFMEACPLLHTKSQQTVPADMQSGHLEDVMLVQSQQLSPLDVEVMPLISEFVVTAGDIGTRASALAQEFPLLASQFAQIPEQWWFQAPKKPNCAIRRQFGSSEPKDQRQKRVSELARWLSTRPEKFIIMVGHCSFWHEFRGKTEKYMTNGEMRCMRW